MESYELLITLGLIVLYWNNGIVANDTQSMCPNVLPMVLSGYVPRVGPGVGIYKKIVGVRRIDKCIWSCCEQKENCNLALMYNETCYNVNCLTNENCQPVKKERLDDIVSMVLVTPFDDGIVDSSSTEVPRWLVIFPELRAEYIKYQRLQSPSSVFTEYEDASMLPGSHNSLHQFSKYITDYRCNVGDNDCREHEQCDQLSPSDVAGVCVCIANYGRDENGDCIPNILNEDDSKSMMESVIRESVYNRPDVSPSTSSGEATKLTVEAVSKNITLPEREATLSVFVVPDDDKYKYLWTIISQPTGSTNGSMKDQTKNSVTLSNLSEGLYQFKVTVNGSNGAYGEAVANLTVLPARRINKKPIVIITPKEQTVKLPNTKAILDGSLSTDDDKIVKWHWDMIQAPISSYQPKLAETSTLQLDDLALPGNYTFTLTVTDSDNAQNSSTATIVVEKSIDYPPEANAGSDVIVYLPNNNVILNGSLSRDDKGIVAWEWTKDANEVSKAVDMQNTRTQYLELSNLEEGVYAFNLKVTDASNQSSNASVHVYVKKPTNLPPVANAGQNTTINLPQNWAILNASQSTDEVRLKSFYWRQISGPNTAVILNMNSSVANASQLTLGLYEFQILVLDENNNNATSSVWIKVIQEKNSAPIARAGGDQQITLPVKAIYLNGSSSWDDLKIVKYQWRRDDSSLAIGTIVGNTDSEPILILTNVVPGRYVFELIVFDEQGLVGKDTVSIIVHSDPLLNDLLELTLTMGVNVLTAAELNSLKQKLGIILDDAQIIQRDLTIDHKSGEAVLKFYVERKDSEGKVQRVKGLEVLSSLNEKLWKDLSILGTSISDLRTTVCQNKCSDHGVCNAETRACMCETFWMPDIFYFWGISEANCDWSILYVIIVIAICFFLMSAICWGIMWSCRRSPSPMRTPKPQKYNLLKSHDEEMPSYSIRESGSDSDTDSDVLFETQIKPGKSILKHSKSNGRTKVTRLGRQIKT